MTASDSDTPPPRDTTPGVDPSSPPPRDETAPKRSGGCAPTASAAVLVLILVGFAVAHLV